MGTILCVNPNAAIDKTLVVEHFQLNTIQRPSLELSLPGGKGCNVARVARALGQQPVVAGWVGGHAGAFIRDGLQAEGIGVALVEAPGESRTCLSILDPAQSTLTEIYEHGRPVNSEVVDAFIDLYSQQLAGAGVVTLSGSLPPGVPPDFYAHLIRLAQDAGVPAILDSSGEALRQGVEGRPYMLKCNRAELSELTGQRLADLNELVQVVRQLAEEMAGWVVITLGAAGAVAAGEGQVWLGQPPRVEAVSAVGSGDAVLAGLACGLLQKQTFESALRLGLAAGTANTLQIGAGRLDPTQIEALIDQIKVSVV